MLLAADVGLGRQLGAAGRQRVCERFAEERITDQTVALYREVIEECASA